MAFERPAHRGSLALLIVGLAAASTAFADESIYRWHEPDGTVVYSDLLPPKSIRTYEVQTIDAPDVSGDVVASAEPELSDSPREAEAATDDEVPQARAALASAIEAKSAGVTPLPGERQRLANGHSRLRPAYFERQRQLEGDVAQARADLEQALESEK